MLRMDSIQTRITKREGASYFFCILQHVYEDQVAGAWHSSRTPLKIGEINVNYFDEWNRSDDRSQAVLKNGIALKCLCVF